MSDETEIDEGLQERSMQILTPRLRLRHFRDDDLAPMHRLFSHALAMQFGASLPHQDVETTRHWLNKRIGIAPQMGEDFVIEHQGRVIGKVGLPQFPEIGFILDPAFWGRGLAREAVEAVLERCFTFHRLGHVTATVDPRNGASLRLLGALGFVETGRRERTLRIGQEWRGSVYLRLDAAVWKSNGSRARDARA